MKFGFALYIFASVTLMTMTSWGEIAGSSSGLGLSAHRPPHVSGEVVRQQHERFSVFNDFVRKPSNQKKPLSEIDLSTFVEVPSFEFIQNEFEALRDERFLESNETPLLRRLTWLFPDDGCYARAELMAKLLDKKGAVAPIKIFAFGDLAARSDNIPGGLVTWWYHVAIAYKFEGVLYVLDPSIEAEHVLTATEWVQRMSVTSFEIEVSLCSAKTFSPNFDCERPREISFENALLEINPFLRQEWFRLRDLNRHPEQELGDFPPWRKPSSQML